MTLKQSIGVSTLVAGIGMAGLLGVGLGTAGANPGPGCDRPGSVQCGDHGGDHRGDPGGYRGQAPADWHNRGIDQGRGDHQPFNWNGQQVTPMRAGNGPGWGFWFLGTWIPL